jgi:hypothetical protein
MRANLINYHPSKTVSDDGLRSALGRNQKCAGPDRTYTIVRCFTLKERIGGKWVIVDIQRDGAQASEWVGKTVTY